MSCEGVRRLEVSVVASTLLHLSGHARDLDPLAQASRPVARTARRMRGISPSPARSSPVEALAATVAVTPAPPQLRRMMPFIAQDYRVLLR